MIVINDTSIVVP